MVVAMLGVVSLAAFRKQSERPDFSVKLDELMRNEEADQMVQGLSEKMQGLKEKREAESSEKKGFGRWR